MNESLSEFLFNMSIVVFFVVAVTLYFVMNGFSNDMVDFIRNDISNQKEIIQIIEEKEELLVSGEDILSDAMVGSVDDFEATANSIDLSAMYTPEPEFDSERNIIKMNYTKK